ncbi:DUF4189 domain-containing protein [Stenotrophomonas sp.]|uniref:DUF4189 domain-containing protein n=1 Tax=Stenotrophomonas sp. TaxID=69392 RepID=UPI0028A99DC4|nr:DUF4189 domain-containing protein [Stenotrophomonas sp.]
MKLTRVASMVVVAVGAMWAQAVPAQQPGSAAYNSVYLPAHGVGDTVRGRGVAVWGAVAVGNRGLMGWTLEAQSEQEATDFAMRSCEAKGAVGCEVLGVFHNACMAIASDIAVVDVAGGHPVTTGVATGNRGMRKLRRDALKECGQGCAIIQEGCAIAGQ